MDGVNSRTCPVIQSLRPLVDTQSRYMWRLGSDLFHPSWVIWYCVKFLLLWFSVVVMLFHMSRFSVVQVAFMKLSFYIVEYLPAWVHCKSSWSNTAWDPVLCLGLGMMPWGDLASSAVAQADEMTHTQHLFLPDHASLLFPPPTSKKLTKQKYKVGKSVVKRKAPV